MTFLSDQNYDFVPALEHTFSPK